MFTARCWTDMDLETGEMTLVRLEIAGWRQTTNFELTDYHARQIVDVITDELRKSEPFIPTMKHADLGSVGFADLGPPNFDDDDIPF